MTDREEKEFIAKELLRIYLYEKEVETDEQKTNFYNLKEVCKEEFDPYNKIFYDVNDKIKNQINRNIKWSNLKETNKTYISKVIPSIVNNLEKIDVYLEDKFQKPAGEVTLVHGAILKSNELDDKFMENKSNIKLLNEIISSYKELLVILTIFKEKYNGINYTWDKKNNNEFGETIIKDDLFTAKIDLNNISGSHIILTNMLNARSIDIEYVDFYNDSYMKRLTVYLDELNPLFKKIYENKLEEEKQNKMELTK